MHEQPVEVSDTVSHLNSSLSFIQVSPKLGFCSFELFKCGLGVVLDRCKDHIRVTIVITLLPTQWFCCHIQRRFKTKKIRIDTSGQKTVMGKHLNDYPSLGSQTDDIFFPDVSVEIFINHSKSFSSWKSKVAPDHHTITIMLDMFYTLFYVIFFNAVSFTPDVREHTHFKIIHLVLLNHRLF